jgi:hypothetical protein
MIFWRLAQEFIRHKTGSKIRLFFQSASPFKNFKITTIMFKKMFFALLLLHLASSATLMAQATNPLTTVGTQASALADTVDNLIQYALLALLGVMVLAIALFICHIYTTFANLNKSGLNSRNFFFTFLIGAAALCTLGSSCTAAQRAQAERYRAAQEAEGLGCPMNQHQGDPSHTTFGYRNSSMVYFNWHSPIFCKRCGQRIEQMGQ